MFDQTKIEFVKNLFGNLMARILLIEDDKQLAWAVKETLARDNHVVDVAHGGTLGLEFLQQYKYDLIILDWMMPGLTGFELCKQYRQQGGSSSVLFLTGMSQLKSKVDALNAGADDYLCKPFEAEELVARTRALLRRSNRFDQPRLKVAHVELDLNLAKAIVDGSEVTLAPNEFQMLEVFMRNPGRVYSSSELQDKLFGADEDSSDDAVRQRINRLRKKIDIDGHSSLIKTIKGIGYCLRETE